MAPENNFPLNLSPIAGILSPQEREIRYDSDKSQSSVYAAAVGVANC